MEYKKNPEFLYKYKPVKYAEDLVRFMDIVKNNRIYMPRYDLMNDPLEGSGININISGYAGISLPLEQDEDNYVVRREKEKFGILSLSASYDNAQLWAHYADNYRGICLCFDGQGKSFESLKQVQYIKDKIPLHNYAADYDQLDKTIEDSFLFKNAGWSYEDEYRIIRKIENEDRFFYFKPEELLGVIIGGQMDDSIMQTIKDIVGDSKFICKSKPGEVSFRINFVDIDYVSKLGGNVLKPLNVDDCLRKVRMKLKDGNNIFGD